MHRRNASERAIRTWKNHFTASLCSTGKEFPMHLWHHLIKQATLTLNLLRASRRNPKVSIYSILEGTFDFNATPMAPPGTKVLIHERKKTRIVGPTWHQRLVPGPGIGTLPMLPSVCQEDQGHTHQRYGGILPHEDPDPICNTNRCAHTSTLQDLAYGYYNNKNRPPHLHTLDTTNSKP
jgi:hypothetical protein